MKLNYKIVLLVFITLSILGVQTKAETEPIKLRGKDDLKEELTVSITAENNGGNEVKIVIEILKNEGNYVLYLFDDKITNGTTPDTWKNLNNIYRSWLRNINLRADIKAKTGTDDLGFDGNFIKYNEQRLERKPFSTGYWRITKRSESTRFTILNGDKKSSLYVTYSFLITEAKTSGESLVGISENFSITIPNDYYYEVQAAVASPAGAAQVDEKIAEWNRKVKEDILVTFLNTENCYSYEDIKKSETLKSIYDKNNTNQKIEEAIASIDNELSDAKYRQVRGDLIRLLNAYKKTEEKPVAVKTVPPKAENKQAQPAKSTTSRLSTEYNEAKKELDYVSEQLNWLERRVNGKIEELSARLSECAGNTNCYAQINQEYNLNYKEWNELLNEYEVRLNRAESHIRNLENDPAFSSSKLNASPLKSSLSDLSVKSKSVKNNMDEFNYRTQENLMNKDSYNKIVQLFKTKGNVLQNRLKYVNDVYNLVYDKDFTGREITKNDINSLKDAKELTDSISKAINGIIEEAHKRYSDETSSKSLPESLFINDVNLPSQTECSLLNSDVETLLTEIKSGGSGGNFFSRVFFALIILIILAGGYIYFRGIVKRKVSKQNTAGKQDSTNGVAGENDMVEGMEILDDNDEKLKAKGLEIVRKLNMIKYYEFDVHDIIEDTAVRKVYFSNEFIIDSYEYFEDKMVEIGSDDLDSLYEYGGYIIGRWDVSLYDDEQYDISLEHFIKPGDDAKFSKFNIDFGYQISFNMETKLIDLAKHNNEQVLVGWLHSHPGHNVFLSNYDIEVQERFRNQFHPNRHIALVFDPNTQDWDMGLFTFKKSGEMNNKEEVKSLMNFHHLYDWALGKKVAERTPNQFRFIYAANENPRVAYSFDKLALTKIKRIAAKKLKNESLHEITMFYGVKEEAGKLGTLVHSLDLNDNDEIQFGSLVETGLFSFCNGINTEINISDEVKNIVKQNALTYIIMYCEEEDNFQFIPLNSQYEPEHKDKWKSFTESDYLPFLTDSSITT